MEGGDEMTEEVWYDCCSSSNVVLIVDDPSNGSLMKTRVKSEARLSSENCGDSESNSSYRTLHGRKDVQLPPSPTPGCSKWLHGQQQLKRKSNENVALSESWRPSSVKINNCINNCKDVVLSSTSKFPAKGLSNIPVCTTNRSCHKRGYSRSPTPTKREENSKPISDSVKWNSQSSLNRYKKLEDPLSSDSETISTNKMNNVSTESEQKSEKVSIKECETKNFTISQKEQVCSLKIIPTIVKKSENSNSAAIADSKIGENEPPTPQDGNVELNGKLVLNQTDICQNIDPHNAHVLIKCPISPLDNNPKCFKATFRNALSKCSRRLLPVKAPPEHLKSVAAAAPDQMSNNCENEMKSIPTTANKACNTRVTGITPKSTILDCSICFDTLLYENTNAESGTKDIKTVVATPCGHIFHEKCIKAWLTTQRKKRCPICCSRCCIEDLLTIFIDAGSGNGSGSEASNESAENKDILEIHNTLIEDYEDLQLRFDELKTEHEFCAWKTVVIQSLQSAYDLEANRRMELEKENEILHQKIHSMKMDVFVAQSKLIKPM